MVAVCSTVEPCLGIVAACLPAMRPLFQSVIQTLGSVRNSLSYSFNKRKHAGKMLVLRFSATTDVPDTFSIETVLEYTIDGQYVYQALGNEFDPCQLLLQAIDDFHHRFLQLNCSGCQIIAPLTTAATFSGILKNGMCPAPQVSRVLPASPAS